MGTRKAECGVCWVPVPITDTGRMVEKTKGLEITLLKELGKLVPYVRNKGRPYFMAFGYKVWAAEKWG